MFESGVVLFFTLLPLVAAVGTYFWFQRNFYSRGASLAISVATAVGFYSIFAWQIYMNLASAPSPAPPEVGIKVDAETLFVDQQKITIQVCSPTLIDGQIVMQCSNKTVGQYPEIITDCINFGEIGSCVDKSSIISALDTASYAFNRISEMSLGNPETVALVIDTSGSTDFDQELEGLQGTTSTGTTPISMQMEAELVGPAFTIEPEGRQRREISSLNPTRWEWEVTPDREGEHPLEVSLYVVLTKEGKKISEDKPLAERQVINVTVSRLDSLISFVQKLDPLRAFIFALVAGLAGLLAWFGIKSWKDVSGKEPEENKPQKIEVTIKDGSKATQDKENN